MSTRVVYRWGVVPVMVADTVTVAVVTVIVAVIVTDLNEVVTMVIVTDLNEVVTMVIVTDLNEVVTMVIVTLVSTAAVRGDEHSGYVQMGCVVTAAVRGDDYITLGMSVIGLRMPYTPLQSGVII